MTRWIPSAVIRDPLCRELVEEIAKNEQVDKKNILCGNGAADLIFRVVWAIRPKNALVAVPTFAEYQLALNGLRLPCGAVYDEGGTGLYAH